MLNCIEKRFIMDCKEVDNGNVMLDCIEKRLIMGMSC